MKSYNHLWEKLISPENIKLAIKNASRGKRKRTNVKYIYGHQDEFIGYYQHLAETYEAIRRKPKEIYDGVTRKKRQITVPTFDEQVLHHMLVNVLAPIIRKGMYRHANGSVPGTGGVRGKKAIKKWIAKSARHVKYYLKLDIKQFFGSIRHDLLKDFIRKRIHDERFLRLLFAVIDCTDIGLPLGFHTSHWLAHWYLQGSDHFIKEGPGAKLFTRYMDDMVIFSSAKKALHRFRVAIEGFLKDIGLRLKENWTVARFDYMRNGKHRGRFLDFMGFRFYRNKITLRKSIMVSIARRARRIWKKSAMTVFDARQMLSALGWIKQSDTYGFYLARIKPIVDFGKCKKKISTFDRNRRKEQLCGMNQKAA